MSFITSKEREAEYHVEAKLRLLHLCLLPSTVPGIEQFDIEFAVLSPFKQHYTAFLNAKKVMKKEGPDITYEATDMGIFEPGYISILQTLRNNLLEK